MGRADPDNDFFIVAGLGLPTPLSERGINKYWWGKALAPDGLPPMALFNDPRRGRRDAISLPAITDGMIRLGRVAQRVGLGRLEELAVELIPTRSAVRLLPEDALLDDGSNMTVRMLSPLVLHVTKDGRLRLPPPVLDCLGVEPDGDHVLLIIKRTTEVQRGSGSQGWTALLANPLHAEPEGWMTW